MDEEFHVVISQFDRNAIYDCRSEEDIEFALKAYFYNYKDEYEKLYMQHYPFKQVTLEEIIDCCMDHYHALKLEGLLKDQDECDYISVYYGDTELHKYMDKSLMRNEIRIIIMQSQNYQTNIRDLYGIREYDETIRSRNN